MKIAVKGFIFVTISHARFTADTIKYENNFALADERSSVVIGAVNPLE